MMPAFDEWTDRVHPFVDGRDLRSLRSRRVRVEDKGAIMAFHWRGARDEEAALAHVEEIAAEAEKAGLATHWGRKVLEVRPPVPVDKGIPVRELVRSSGVTRAIYGGDDVTDLDAFAALDDLVEAGDLEMAIRVGIRSDDGPRAIVERADIAVDGPQGFASLLTVLAESLTARRRALRRLPPYHRAALGVARPPTLGAVSVLAADAEGDTTLLGVALGWWAHRGGRRRLDGPGRAALGRDRPPARRRPARTRAAARGRSRADGAEPPVAARPAHARGRRPRARAAAGARGGHGLPPHPRAGAGGPQARAVTAIEDRDGVRFYMERTSPLRPTRLVRAPGLRKLDPGLERAAARAEGARR